MSSSTPRARIRPPWRRGSRSTSNSRWVTKWPRSCGRPPSSRPSRHFEPFPAEEPEAERHRLYVMLLRGPLGLEARERLLSLRTEADDLHVHGREVYWLCRVPFADSPLAKAPLEKTMAMPSTTRNVTTLRKNLPLVLSGSRACELVIRQTHPGDASMKRHLLTLVLTGLVGSLVLAGDAQACHLKKCHHAAPTCAVVEPAALPPRPRSVSQPVSPRSRSVVCSRTSRDSTLGCHKKAACEPAPAPSAENSRLLGSRDLLLRTRRLLLPQGSAQH